MENLFPVSVDAWRSDVASAPARTSGGGAAATGFAALMGDLQSPSPSPPAGTDPRPALYTISSGDTLTGIVQNLAQQRGVPLDADQRHRLALELAGRNQIANPNRIMPGQTLQVGALHASLDQIEAPPSGATGVASFPRPHTGAGAAPTALTSAGASGSASTQAWLARRGQPVAPTSPGSLALLSPQTRRAIPMAGSTAAPTTGTQPVSNTPAGASAGNPVLQQTLDRAVARGFIPAQERQAVQDKIVQLSQKYHFAPDDFARMTLMESDGMNPKASNQRCHGIIQFCDGPNRGAATVGFAQQPRAILGLSVYQQLSLVDTYFQEAGVGKQGPASLDDLYLSVLQPAARQEKLPHAPLPILGPQARDLHVGADTRQAITRQSIVQGLLKNTRDKLGQLFGQNASAHPTPAAVPTQVSQAQTERSNPLR